jgi:hypothetical protein
MQRGKAPVQHDEGDMVTVLRPLNMGRQHAMCSTECGQMPHNGEAPAELSGHIVEQLRATYDALLQEPIPDHLRVLLAHLSDAEEKS